MNMFEKWNSNVDLKGLQEDVKKAQEEGDNREYEKVPHGEYEVKLDSLELVASKKGDPMVKAQYTILQGKYKNSKLWMYQVVLQGFQIHIANNFLKSLKTDLNIEFVDYAQYANLLLDVAEFCDTNKLEFAIKYEDNKGYDKFTITEVFEA